MAAVTLKYIKSRQQIKAHLRYIVHRKGKSREKITRELFNRDGLTDKRAIYQMIDNAKRGTIFFKIMISPDPMKEDTRRDLDLQHITRRTISKLEKQFGRQFQFVATVHNDHTPLRHVHGIFLLQGRLSREEFRALQKTAYQTATRSARRQRKAHDRVRANPRYRSLNRQHALTRSVSAGSPGRQGILRSIKPLRQQSACRSCGYGQSAGIPSYQIFCPNCHARLKRDRTVGLSL
jgi:hypothetical protein